MRRTKVQGPQLPPLIPVSMSCALSYPFNSLALPSILSSDTSSRHRVWKVTRRMAARGGLRARLGTWSFQKIVSLGPGIQSTWLDSLDWLNERICMDRLPGLVVAQLWAIATRFSRESCCYWTHWHATGMRVLFTNWKHVIPAGCQCPCMECCWNALALPLTILEWFFGMVLRCC